MKKIKHSLGDLLLNKNFFFIVLFFFLFSSCRQNSEIQRIKDYFAEVHHYTIKANQIIILLSDYGCLHCNRTFSENEIKYIANKKVVFLIMANESYLDLSRYLNKKNVFFDNKKILSDYGIDDKSGFIEIKNNKIDTIVHIKYDKVLDQVNFLDKSINNL